MFFVIFIIIVIFAFIAVYNEFYRAQPLRNGDKIEKSEIFQPQICACGITLKRIMIRR